MNPARQFDVHPDAEILNGFVENVLPEAERAEVLAHLGACGRCRQIVYLAQDALPAADGPARAAMAERRVVDGERAWVLRWKTAWAAGLAFAAIAAFAVFVTIRHREPVQEFAKLALNPAPSVPAAAPPATPMNPAGGSKATAELQAASPAAAAQKPVTRARPGTAAAPATPAAAAPPPAPLAEGGPVSRTEAEAKSYEPSATLNLSAPMSPAKPAPSTAMRATQFRGAIHGERSLGNAQAGGSGAGAASETVEVNASPVQPAAPAQAEAVAPPEVAGASDDEQSGLILLPSRLPLVSTAEAGQTQLAIDAMGSLFLSRDLGKSWQLVRRQWTGRLIKVRMAPALKARNSLLPEPAEKPQLPAPGAVSIPAALFEIVNDKNSVWTSADGKTWTAK